jgi:hypothetical protein
MAHPFRPPVRAGLIAAAAFALAACSDSPSGPPTGGGGGGGGSLTVAITASMTQPNFLRAPVDPAATLECPLVLHGKATGPAGATAQWGNGVFRFFAGPQRDVPIDSFTVTADEIRQSWDPPTITAGAVMESRWRLSAGVPFAITADLDYGVAGSTVVHKASFAASCGPAAPAGTAGPTLSSVSVAPGSGELQAGQGLAVTYTLAAPAGAWETSVLLTGAATGEYRVRETFQTADTRTVTVQIPANATLAGALRVYVRATDSFLRAVQVEAANTLAVVDHTPPTLLRVAMNATTVTDGNHIAGQFGAGDTIQAYWFGQDENALQWVGWGIDGASPARDSVLVSAAGANPLRIAVLPEWAGAPALRLWVADRGGNHSPEMVSAAGAFRVFPVRTRPVRAAQTPGAADDAVIDERRGLLYVSMRDPGRIAVLSLATMTFGTPIALPGNPGAIDLTVGGDSLLVLLPDASAVGVVSLPQPGAAVATVPINTPWARSLRVAADGRVLVSLLGQLADVDLATGAIHVLASDGGNVSPLGRTRDRSRVVFAGNCRFDYVAASHTVTPCQQAYTGARRPSLDDAGRVVSFGTYVYGPQGLIIFPQELGLTGSVAPSPDGSEVFLGTARGLLRARPDGVVLDRTSSLPALYGRLLFTDGGATLVSVDTPPNQPNTRVYAVDLR